MKLLNTIRLGCLTLIISGCAGITTGQNRIEQQFTPRTVKASGHHAIVQPSGVTEKQAELHALQNATLQAYRKLAAQVYRQPLSNGRSVATQVIGNEKHRTFVDLYLRNARAEKKQINSHAVSTSLVLDLDVVFFQCMDGTAEQVESCINASGKTPFTRLGYNQAESRTVNLACGSVACDGMFHVGGFDRRKNPVDRFLLNAGLYDSEWTVNTSARLVSHFLLLQTIPDL